MNSEGDDLTLANLLNETHLDSKERELTYHILNSQGYKTIQRLRECSDWKTLINQYTQEQINIQLQECSSLFAKRVSPIRIFVSGRVLFFMEEEHKTYVQHGKQAFDELMAKTEKVVLPPGVAMNFILACCSLNTLSPVFEIYLVTEISGIALKRVHYSLNAYGLIGIHIQGYDGAVKSSSSVLDSLRSSSSASASSSSSSSSSSALDSLRSSSTISGAYESTLCRFLSQQPDLFLSADPDDVRFALAHRIPAALVNPRSFDVKTSRSLNLAFDYDNCLVDDQSEIKWQLLQNQTTAVRLREYWNQEYSKKDIIQKEGSLLSFATRLFQLRQILPDNIKLYLVTARNRKASLRVMSTLDAYGLDFDGYTFGVKDKTRALDAFQIPIHMFFDDQQTTVDHVADSFPAARVYTGVTNISMHMSISKLS